MIYELRIYSVVPGRIDVSLTRFEKHLPALFERHGIHCVGRWIATAGPQGPSFVYMMRYESLAQREEQWSSFYLDQEWYAVRGATQGDEEATERFDILFLRQNPVWKPRATAPDERAGGIHDLLLMETALGQGPAVNRFILGTYLPLLERSGARTMLVADVMAGPALPRSCIMLDWPDAGTRHDGWREFTVSAGLREAYAQQRRQFGRALTGRTDSYTLEPTAFALPLACLGSRTDGA